MKKANVYKNMRGNQITNKNIINYQRQMTNFIENVLSPKLDEIGLFDYTDDYFEKDQKKIERYANNFIKSINTDNKKQGELSSLLKNINFNKKDITILQFLNDDDALNKTILYIERTKEFNKKCEDFINDYIIPVLNQFSKDNKIIFDMKSKDQQIILNTQKILKILSLLVYEKGSLGAYMKIGCINFEKDFSNEINFLYIDNDEIKKNIAKKLCNDFLERYDKIDMINTDNFTSREFYSL